MGGLKMAEPSQTPKEYVFSFGPWNIHEGADPFGPAVRPTVAFANKLGMYKKMGFDGIQFHDDDVVPGIMGKSPDQVRKDAIGVYRMIQDKGLTAEFVAPRLWEDPKTIHGAYTSNVEEHRRYALERTKRALDVADAVEATKMVLWLAREGTYFREAKDPIQAHGYLVDAINGILDYHPTIRILIEPKPNEPMDQSYIPTMGHAIAIGYRTKDPIRVGGLVESAHSILAGLDPSDEMAFALSYGKLWSVHLNDQDGLKFDQDKAFGSVNLRRACNQVKVLEQSQFGLTSEMVGLDVKAMRTQPAEVATQHLANSRQTFLYLVDKVRSFDWKAANGLAVTNPEQLEQMIVRHILGS